MKLYYKLFNLDETCSVNDIKREYKKLIRIYHPDKNKNSKKSNNNFISIQNAYFFLLSKHENKIHTCEDILIQILHDYTISGDIYLDNTIKYYGENIEKILSKKFAK